MSGRFLLLFLQNEKGVKTFNIPFLFTSPQPRAHDEIVWTFLSSLQGASMGHRVKNYVERYHAEFWGFLDNLFFLLNCKPPAIKPFNLNLSKCTFHCFSSWGLSFPPLSIIIDFFCCCSHCLVLRWDGFHTQLHFTYLIPKLHNAFMHSSGYKAWWQF